MSWTHCPNCGRSYVGHGTVCQGPPMPEYGRYQYSPYQLTEADIRRIVREELERAKERKP